MSSATSADPDDCHLDEKQKEAIDRVIASDEVPADMKEMARETARKWGYDPSIGGDSS